MYLSDVDHFPDALSQAANGWVGVESVPTFNRSVDEAFWRKKRQNILAKNIEDKKLFHKNKQYILAYLPKSKIQSIVANKFKYKIFVQKKKTKSLC